MKASPCATSSAESWAEQLHESLQRQRDRVQQFLAAQQERMGHVEDALGQQLRDLIDEVAQNRDQLRQAQEETGRRADQLAQQTRTLEDLKEELATRQAEWEEIQKRTREQHDALAEQIRGQQGQLDRCREELAKRQSEIDAAEATLHHDRQALELARQEHQAEVERTATLRENLEAQQAELGTHQAQLAAGRADTEKQRRRIARQLKAQHAAQLKELQRRQAQLQRRDAREQSERVEQLEAARRRQTELTAEIEAAQQREKELAAEATAARQREKQLEADVASAQQRQTELEAELEPLRKTRDQLQEELARQVADGGAAAEKLQDVEAERDALLARVAEAESRLAEAERHLAAPSEGGRLGPCDQQAEDGSGAQPGDADWPRRYEMLLEDLRQVKAQNAELQRQLAQAPPAQPPRKPTGGGLDWEAQKQQILAALESDSDEPDEAARAERAKIEEVIRATDQALAEKDRQCEELRQLLEQQSAQVGSVAVGAAALGEMVDSDTVIQEEREKLKHLQEEWREKLRQAEIDISIERAKIARQRTEIEEKLRAIHNRGNQAERQPDTPASPDKPARGRWLTRLGLKDDEEQ